MKVSISHLFHENETKLQGVFLFVFESKVISIYNPMPGLEYIDTLIQDILS